MRSGSYVPIGTLAALSARSDPDLVEIDSRLPADALEWADTTASEVIRQPVERNCAAV
jgi:hypothetical protein